MIAKGDKLTRGLFDGPEEPPAPQEEIVFLTGGYLFDAGKWRAYVAGDVEEADTAKQKAFCDVAGIAKRI